MRSGGRLVDALAEQLEASRHLMRHLRPQATAWRVHPTLVAQPVINTRYLIDHLNLSEATANRVLTALAEAGVLQERSGKMRDRDWHHDGILAVLDAYVTGLRRG